MTLGYVCLQVCIALQVLFDLAVVAFLVTNLVKWRRLKVKRR